MKWMQKLWNRLRMVVLFFRLIKNPNRTDLIFRGVDLISRDPNQQALAQIEKRVLANLSFREMFHTAYVPAVPSLERLKKMDKNSFGFAVYQHMNTNHLDFDLFPRLNPEKFVNYLGTRIYQDHDLWHTLLGYGVTIEDELALQAFGVAQFYSPIGTVLIAGGLLHLIVKNPAQAVIAFRKIVDGYCRGQKASFLLSQRLHDLFLEPLIDVRRKCNVIDLANGSSI
jgi:ubiquinone biosynthesis protein Coq4